MDRFDDVSVVASVDESPPAPRAGRGARRAFTGVVAVVVATGALAGAGWRATFAEGGWENVKRHMEVNFDAVVRLTEALLPLLRGSAPSAIVNVSSTAGRVARPGSGAYSASKFALAGWSDALAGEEGPNGDHVGIVLPGFITTEGFPQKELVENPLTRRLVSTPERGAQAIVDAGLGRKHERYVPRPYALAAVARVLLPPLVRLATGSKAGGKMVTRTGAMDRE